MAFLAIKNNPFEEYGSRWDGAGERAAEAADAAAEAAAMVLREAVEDKSAAFDQWDEDLISKIEVVRDANGQPRVGLGDSASVDDHERAFRAEYGDKDQPPQALMRTAQKRAQEAAEEVANRVLSEGIIG